MFTDTYQDKAMDVVGDVMDRVHHRPKPISSRVHAMLDYATVVKMLALPRLLGARPAVTRAVTMLALGKLAYSMLTRHEGGVYKAIPMRTHLVLDAIGGAGLAAIPFLLEEDNELVTAALVGLGLFDVVAAPLTQTEPPVDEDLAYWAGFGPLLYDEAGIE